MNYKKIKTLGFYVGFVGLFMFIISYSGALISSTFFSANVYVYLALVASSLLWIENDKLSIDHLFFIHRLGSTTHYMMYLLKRLTVSLLFFTLGIGSINYLVSLFLKIDYPGISQVVDLVNIFLNVLIINYLVLILSNKRSTKDTKLILVLIYSFLQFYIATMYPIFVWLSCSLIQGLSNSLFNFFLSYAFNLSLVFFLAMLKLSKDDLV